MNVLKRCTVKGSMNVVADTSSPAHQLTSSSLNLRLFDKFCSKVCIISDDDTYVNIDQETPASFQTVVST